jgi:type I restriction enzyme S subunit
MLTLKQHTMLGDVPDDWTVKSLKTLLEFNAPGDWGDDGGPHMFFVLRSTNLTNERRLDLSDIALRALKPAKAEQLAPCKGDILLERSGGGPGQPVGRVGYVAVDLPGHAFSNFLHLLRPDAAEINAEFLSWVLFRVNRTGRILRLEQQTTQMRNLNFRDYLTMPLPVPPPDEQAAIARVLDAVDAAIDRAREALHQSKTLLASLISELINGCVKAHKLVELGEYIADGPTNGLYRPESDYGAKGTPIVRIDSFGDGTITDLPGLRRVVVPTLLRERFALKHGDVLINRVNALTHVGKAVVTPKISEPTIFESNMMRLRCAGGLLPDFLGLILRSDIARRHWLARAKPAVNQVSINQRDVKALRVPLPDIKHQRDVTRIVSAADAVIAHHTERLDAYHALKKSLMHDLLTGSVRVHPALFK